MELELGLALPDSGVRFGGKKRGFGEAFGAGHKATLPLCFARGNEGGDESRGGGGDDDHDCQRTDDKRRKILVGWPPVKCAPHHRRRGSGYVKVRMEGVAIGRKVDVSLHGSYDDLRRTLDRMFPSSANNRSVVVSAGGAGTAEEEDGVVAGGGRRRRHRREYVVTYEDGEGDWLLVGDVPWEVFAKTVKRLKILA